MPSSSSLFSPDTGSTRYDVTLRVIYEVGGGIGAKPIQAYASHPLNTTTPRHTTDNRISKDRARYIQQYIYCTVLPVCRPSINYQSDILLGGEKARRKEKKSAWRESFVDLFTCELRTSILDLENLEGETKRAKR